MRTVLVIAALVYSIGSASAQYNYNRNGSQGGIIVDQNGAYHGNANNNQFDQNSVSNPYGRYGSQYSPDSINNQYGAGNPYNGNQYRVLGR